MLEFNESDHTYWLDGKRLVSVTQVLEVLSPFNATAAGIEAGTRGTIIHDAAQFFDEECLDIDAVPEDCIGHVLAWQKFRAECKFEVLDIEKTFAHVKHGYAGRVDRIVAMGNIGVLLDIKSGAERPTHPLQLAAYVEGYQHWTENKIKKSACVYLRGDGTYRVRWQDDTSALYDFLAALRCYRWKERNQ